VLLGSGRFVTTLPLPDRLLANPASYRPRATLARGLDQAAARGWLVVDMKQDWRVIYPEEAG